MRIGTHDTAERVLVVAEAGNNHEGKFEVAEQLVREAAAAGADAVKFQTFRTELFVRSADAERYLRLERFELTIEQFRQLAALARSLGLLFISTPLDLESAAELAPIVDGLKVASGDNDFVPLLERIAQAQKPVIISTGVSGMADVERSVAVVRRIWNAVGFEGEIGLLQCVSCYPVDDTEVNLRSIEALRDAFPECTIGYSDHTLDIEAAVLSVGLGARIVEKHFTIDKRFSDFRDHALSADPDELRELVRRVRRTESMLGRRQKEVRESEQPMVQALRRSIVASRGLTAGHRIDLSDLLWLRPGGGLKPGEESVLLGRTLLRDVVAGEQLSPSDVT